MCPRNVYTQWHRDCRRSTFSLSDNFSRALLGFVIFAYFSLALFARALFPVMKRQRGGAMVVFTSGLATQGWPGATAYGASKAGLIALVKSAAQELKEHGVRINAVSPGIMNTPLFQDSASAEEVAMYQRTLGVSEPEEVTPMLMHLISDGAATISGNVLERRLIPKTQNESTEF
jgi:NAD(P)-dependent dehydrogenase (short-subunit alcohol dehydrogenase family)